MILDGGGHELRLGYTAPAATLLYKSGFWSPLQDCNEINLVGKKLVLLLFSIVKVSTMYRLFAINKGQRGAHETSSDWNSSLLNACCLLNIVLELNEEEVEYYWFHTDLIIPSPFVTNLWIL